MRIKDVDENLDPIYQSKMERDTEIEKLPTLFGHQETMSKCKLVK